MLTTFDLDEYVFAALRAGASGFLLKDTPADAVRLIMQRLLVRTSRRPAGSPWSPVEEPVQAGADRSEQRQEEGEVPERVASGKDGTVGDHDDDVGRNRTDGGHEQAAHHPRMPRAGRRGARLACSWPVQAMWIDAIRLSLVYR